MKAPFRLRHLLRPFSKTALLSLFALLLLCAGCDTAGVGDDDQDDDTETIPQLELVAEGMTAPVMLVEAPDESGRLFIVDQAGVIHLVDADGTRQSDPFLDLSDQIVDLRTDFDERGLLGLAFHPDFEVNGRFFVYYSAPLRPEAPDGFDHTSHLSEFQVSAGDPNEADPNSERILLQVDQPQFNHNGGTVAFGPEDGYLYISLGDGGNRDDVGVGHVEDWYEENEGGNGQDITENLLGNILRIDVDGGDPYGIPPDNPFVDEDGLDEIHAYGLRNPYRFSFDMGGDNALLSSDAGQELWEEVSLVTAGGNYGWNVKEGAHCFDAEHAEHPEIENCPDEVGEGHPREGDPLIDPVIEFKNAHQEGSGPQGLVVVGGFVYRGEELPELDGQYIFGTWSTEHEAPKGRVFVSEPQGTTGLWPIDGLRLQRNAEGRLNHYLLGFGQDRDGEVYLLTSDTEGPTGSSGRAYKLTAKETGSD